MTRVSLQRTPELYWCSSFLFQLCLIPYNLNYSYFPLYSLLQVEYNYTLNIFQTFHVQLTITCVDLLILDFVSPSLFVAEKNCKAESIKTMQKEMKNLFGLGEENGKTGYYGINGILRWPLLLPYRYNGQQECRGMMCDRYEVCIKNDQDGTTALITYYWSCRLRFTMLTLNPKLVFHAIRRF